MHGIFTSESVTEGHPDKVCDFIADSVLDAHLRRDPKARIAVEVLAKGNHVILAGAVGGAGDRGADFGGLLGKE